jgi:ketosteroid isomerase-like protein
MSAGDVADRLFAATVADGSLPRIDEYLDSARVARITG